MKKVTLILLIGFIISSCGEYKATKEIKEAKSLDTITQENTKIFDTINNIYDTKKYVDSLSLTNNKQEISKKDSVIYIANNSFRDLELNLVDITKEQFNNYLSDYIKNNLKNCGFSRLNLKDESDCDEICETYLMEINSNKKLYLPCDYDAGILGASFSHNCNKLIVCSSYDGPDFDNYYENRAEFYLFKIVGTDGLNSLQPFLKFSTKKWSIEDCIWISDNEVGLKLYSEQRWGNGSQLEYKYFRTSIPK